MGTLSPQQSAEFNQIAQSNHALAAAHQITHVEAEKRNMEAMQRLWGSQFSDTDRLIASYRIALASQIDSGQITPETAQYLFQQRVHELDTQDRAGKAAALAANRPINCNSMVVGRRLIPLSQVRPYLAAGRSRRHDFGSRFARRPIRLAAFPPPSFSDAGLA